MNKLLPSWAGKALQDRRDRLEDPEAFALRSVVRPQFDREYYLRNNPDVAEADIDPVEHYLSFGWAEGRNPHPDFSPRDYLWNNPDVEAAGVDPFWHYLAHGRDEGRRVFEPPEPDPIQTLFDQPDLEEEVAFWTEDWTAPDLVSPAVVRAGLQASLARGDRELVISFGQDNYRENTGGVQLCLQREERAATEGAMTYLNLSPYQPLPRLAHDGDRDAGVLRIVLNGETLGVLPFDAVRDLIEEVAPELARTSFVIHHLLGHMPEQVIDLAQVAGVSEAWFWLHDYFAICPGYTLMRNNRVFCVAPPPTSLSCTICRFGAERLQHLERMRHLFAHLDMHVIAPSEVARDIWTETADLPYRSLTVLAHANLVWEARQDEDETTEQDRPDIRVAYVGSPMPHKGWGEFKKIQRALRDDKTISFHYFGTADVPSRIAKTPVRVTEDDLHAMMQAIKDKAIDVVVMWAHWPETFSFATLEAIAGGAYVVTNPKSGNVAALVQALGRGVVLEGDDGLLAYFQGPELRAAVERHRAHRARHIPRLENSNMTIPLLDQGG